jgi:hypothetical protein
MMALAGKDIIGISKFKFSNLTDDQKRIMEEGYEKVETLEVIYDSSLPKELRELRIGDTVNLKVDGINRQCIVTEKCDKAFHLSIKPVRPEVIMEERS